MFQYHRAYPVILKHVKISILIVADFNQSPSTTVTTDNNTEPFTLQNYFIHSLIQNCIYNKKIKLSRDPLCNKEQIESRYSFPSESITAGRGGGGWHLTVTIRLITIRFDDNNIVDAKAAKNKIWYIVKSLLSVFYPLPLRKWNRGFCRGVKCTYMYVYLAVHFRTSFSFPAVVFACFLK